ncbi:unnamed protein product [Pedinophyceae sp. YPF-701]|nr:unnamed protein product [Pedinophyceae sp. YPF-701]
MGCGDSRPADYEQLKDDFSSALLQIQAVQRENERLARELDEQRQAASQNAAQMDTAVVERLIDRRMSSLVTLEQFMTLHDHAHSHDVQIHALYERIKSLESPEPHQTLNRDSRATSHSAASTPTEPNLPPPPPRGPDFAPPRHSALDDPALHVLCVCPCRAFALVRTDQGSYWEAAGQGSLALCRAKRSAADKKKKRPAPPPMIKFEAGAQGGGRVGEVICMELKQGGFSIKCSHPGAVTFRWNQEMHLFDMLDMAAEENADHVGTLRRELSLLFT